jgi:hypothetical protein
VNTVLNLRVLYKVENFLTSRVSICFSRRTLLLGVSDACNRGTLGGYIALEL